MSTNVLNMAPVGKQRVNTEKAQLNGLRAKGAALAAVVVAFSTKEAKEEENRGKKRLKIVADIKSLSPEGHAQFRADLQQELTMLSEIEKAAGDKASRHGGYSAASYRVMVSNWRTISVACEAGMAIEADGVPMAWEAILDKAREVRKAQQAITGKSAVQGGRKAGAGRKAKSAYEKAFDAVVKLDKKDQRRMLDALAASFHATVAYPEPAAKRPAGRKAAALADAAAADDVHQPFGGELVQQPRGDVGRLQAGVGIAADEGVIH